jgi:hypothetical protein
MIFENHRFEFEIHLENISGFDKASDLIKTLIYQNKNFDDYAEYLEKDFIGDIRADTYPSQLDDNGTDYIFRFNLIADYSVEYYSDSFIIIEYSGYTYYAMTAHGSYWTVYRIIDIAEERILDIAELINPIPDGLLKQFIEEKYDINYYLQEEIWAPGSVNFSNENIELIWNIYHITPYSAGLISIEIPDDIIQQYLTDKGKILKMEIDSQNK